MSYVPVYLTAGDDCSNAEAHTSSRSGRVQEVWARVNTHFGEALSVNVFSNGGINRVSESHCTERIGHWNSKGNKNKVKYWQAKLVDAIEHNTNASANESVKVGAEFRFGNSKMHFNLNGINVTQSDLDILAMMRSEDWEGVLQLIQSRLPNNTDLLSHVVSKKV
jgi:hypothetical protein|tara:strand:- start:100 stop:594 length:495 start_codon:yes stop_codon:yes gene_type:complete